jgi:protocatechuate 3,4-dioxygenase beta subunit
VRGRVVDRAGRPIAGLTVFLEPHVGSHSDAYLYGTVTWTDEDGRYRFRALPSSGYSFRYDGRGNWHHYYLNKTLAENATVVPVHVTETYRLKRQVVKRPS